MAKRITKPSSAPSSSVERRARWELTKLIRLLVNPPTEHKATCERLARIAEEVREEISHVGGSFEQQLAAAYALLSKRPCHTAHKNAFALSLWAKRHVATLDRERVKRTGTVETTDGPMAHADFYPVPGDEKDTDTGLYSLVPDDELAAVD